MLKNRMTNCNNRIISKSKCITSSDNEIELSNVDFEDNIIENIDKKILLKDIDRMLNKVTKNQRKIIELYFGLNGGESYYPLEISKMFKKSRGNIEKTKSRALNTLRKYKNELIKYKQIFVV